MDSRRLTRAFLAADKIRQAIIDGEYLSGERLIELTLANKLDVSQITVREALMELEQQGWVVKKSRRGVYVRAFDRDSAADLFSLYAAVGGLALDAVASASTRKALVREVRVLYDLARRLTSGGDRAGAVTALFDMHVKIGDVSGRTLTAQLLAMLVNQARLLEAIRQSRIPGTLTEMKRTIDQHDRLLAMLEQGDAAGARAALADIIEAYRSSVDEALAVR